MPGKFWRDLAFDRFEFLIGVGARQIEEDGRDAGKVPAASFERFDGIFEGRWLWIGRDFFGIGMRKAKRDLEGLPKVAWPQAIEWRRAKRPCPWFEKRVFFAETRLIHVAPSHAKF